jgi:hypothetical protein
VYYIFSKNIETENDVICIDEWARYVSWFGVYAPTSFFNIFEFDI